MKARMFQRTMIASEWASVNPILGKGEIGYDETNNQARIGDGVKRWLQLPPIGATLEQIEQLVEAYLAANPPATSVTATPHPSFPGVVVLATISGGGGGESGTPAAPVVLQDPSPIERFQPSGSAVTLSATASGTPAPSVQWQYDQNLDENWVNVAGATSATFVFTLDSTNEGAYRAVFTNASGTATTATATVWRSA